MLRHIFCCLIIVCSLVMSGCCQFSKSPPSLSRHDQKRMSVLNAVKVDTRSCHVKWSSDDQHIASQLQHCFDSVQGRIGFVSIHLPHPESRVNYHEDHALKLRELILKNSPLTQDRVSWDYLEDRRHQGIVVNVRSYRVIPPQCQKSFVMGKMSSDSLPALGCANYANLGSIIFQPSDLIEGQPVGSTWAAMLTQNTNAALGGGAGGGGGAQTGSNPRGNTSHNNGAQSSISLTAGGGSNGGLGIGVNGA